MFAPGENVLQVVCRVESSKRRRSSGDFGKKMLKTLFSNKKDASNIFLKQETDDGGNESPDTLGSESETENEKIELKSHNQNSNEELSQEFLDLRQVIPSDEESTEEESSSDESEQGPTELDGHNGIVETVLVTKVLDEKHLESKDSSESKQEESEGDSDEDEESESIESGHEALEDEIPLADGKNFAESEKEESDESAESEKDSQGKPHSDEEDVDEDSDSSGDEDLEFSNYPTIHKVRESSITMIRAPNNKKTVAVKPTTNSTIESDSSSTESSSEDEKSKRNPKKKVYSSKLFM